MVLPLKHPNRTFTDTLDTLIARVFRHYYMILDYTIAIWEKIFKRIEALGEYSYAKPT